MPTPLTSVMQEVAAKAALDYARQQERLLRQLLSQWVSELEPVVIYGGDALLQIKGLGIADDPTGMIVVQNLHWRPGFMDMLLRL